MGLVTHLVLVQEEVGSFEVTVNDFVLVEVVHSFGDVNGQAQQHWHFQESLLLAQVVVYTSTRHVFCDDTQVGGNGASANELHYILVPDLSHNKHFLLKLSLQILIQALRLQNLNGYVLSTVRSSEPGEQLELIFLLKKVGNFFAFQMTLKHGYIC
jgi:hypothetical protein